MPQDASVAVHCWLRAVGPALLASTTRRSQPPCVPVVDAEPNTPWRTRCRCLRAHNPELLRVTGCLTVFIDEPCPFQQLIDHLTGQPHGRLDVNKQAEFPSRLPSRTPLLPFSPLPMRRPRQPQRGRLPAPSRRVQMASPERGSPAIPKGQTPERSGVLLPRPMHSPIPCRTGRSTHATISRECQTSNRFVVFREKPVWIEVSGNLIETIRIEYAINVDQEQRLCAGV